MTDPPSPSTASGPVGRAAALVDRRSRWFIRAAWLVLLAGVLAFVVEGANRPPDPYLVPVDDTEEQR